MGESRDNSFLGLSLYLVSFSEANCNALFIFALMLETISWDLVVFGRSKNSTIDKMDILPWEFFTEKLPAADFLYDAYHFVTNLNTLWNSPFK